MRKRIAAMLAAVLVALCLVPQAAMAEGTTVKVADENELLTALADENVGTIVLADDISLATTGIEVNRTVVIDLCGHSISDTAGVRGWMHGDAASGGMFLTCSILVDLDGDLSLVNSAEKEATIVGKRSDEIDEECVLVLGTLRVSDGVTVKAYGMFMGKFDKVESDPQLYMNGGTFDLIQLTTMIWSKSTIYANGGEIRVTTKYNIKDTDFSNCTICAGEGSSGTRFYSAKLLINEDGSVISAGIFDAELQNLDSSEIDGGTFNGKVTNEATISDGIFNGHVANEGGTISGGTFNGEVTGAYTITFDSDGGTEVAKQVRAKAAATKPKDPVKKGYAFLGWYNGNTAYDFTDELPAETGTLTLTAKWAEDDDAPKIFGLVDGGTYHSAVTFQVSDNYKVASVTANGEELAPNENGSYTLALTNGRQEVVVTDTAQNATIVTVTVGHHGGIATCTSKAVCEVCEADYGELDPSNHSALEHVAAKEATTQAEGNIGCWFCSDCDKYFADEAAVNEIAQADTVIAKKAEGAGSTESTAFAVSASTRKSTKGKMPATGDARAAVAAPAAAGIALVAVGVLARRHCA